MNLKDHRVVTPALEYPQVDFELQEMFDFEMTDKENSNPEPIPDVTSHPSPPVSEESADETTTAERDQSLFDDFSRAHSLTLELSDDTLPVEKEQNDFLKKQNSTSEPFGGLIIEKEQSADDDVSMEQNSTLESSGGIIIEKEQSAVDAFLKKQHSISEAFDKKNGITRKRVETESESESERIYERDMKKLQKKGRKIEMKEKIRRQERHRREIAEQMLSDNFAIQSHVFRKIVHSIMDWKYPNHRIRYNAIEALQRETEMMLTKMMRLGCRMSAHAKRKTLQVEDLRELTAILEINKEGSTFMV